MKRSWWSGGQEEQPSRQPACFPLFHTGHGGSASRTGCVIWGGSLTHSEQHLIRGLLGTSRACESENTVTLGIRTPKRRGPGKPQEKPGRDMPAFSKFPLSKQRWGVLELYRLPPRGPVALCGLSSESVPILPFPKDICRLLSHLSPEGGTEVSAPSRTRGRRHVAK